MRILKTGPPDLFITILRPFLPESSGGSLGAYLFALVSVIVRVAVILIIDIIIEISDPLMVI